MEPSAAVPWSVLIAVGGTLISSLTAVIIALLSSRLRNLERQVEDTERELRALKLETTTDRGTLQWLKASDAQRKDETLPRELVLQRFEQQDQQLARIEHALARKVSVDAMPAAQQHSRRDERADPQSDPPSSMLPPMRARLPSSRGR